MSELHKEFLEGYAVAQKEAQKMLSKESKESYERGFIDGIVDVLLDIHPDKQYEIADRIAHNLGMRLVNEELNYSDTKEPQ